MNRALSIGILIVSIIGTTAYSYAKSERQTIVVESKYVKDLRGRWHQRRLSG